MEVWVPPVNRVKDHQFIKMNLFDEEYWYLYGNETDPEIRNKLLYTYDNPEKENERRMLHTDSRLEEKNETVMIQPEIGHDQRNLQNFDTLNDESRRTRNKQNTSAYYDPKYNEKWKNDANKKIYTRAMDMAIMIEAKPDPTRPLRTVLTVDHFREI